MRRPHRDQGSWRWVPGISRAGRQQRRRHIYSIWSKVGEVGNTKNFLCLLVFPHTISPTSMATDTWNVITVSMIHMWQQRLYLVISQYRQSLTSDDLTCDFSTWWWFRSNLHSVETVLRILNVNLFWAATAQSSLVMLGRAESCSSRSAAQSPGQTTPTRTTILFLTFSMAFNQLHELFNTSL